MRPGRFWPVWRAAGEEHEIGVLSLPDSKVECDRKRHGILEAAPLKAAGKTGWKRI